MKIMSSIVSGVGVKFCAAALCAAAVGCASTKAEWGGEDVVRGEDGAPLVDKDGKVQTVGRPVKLSAWRHWFDSEIQSAELAVEGEKLNFKLAGYNGRIDTNLVTLVDVSLSGVALLAEKVGAAIATSGGSVAGDAAAASLKAAIARFVAKGGDAANATVTCTGGDCTFTDGTVTETCTDCVYTGK